MNLSVIIPTLNEEKFIGPCIRALRQEFSGEILISDGLSSDQTVQIAKNLEANVVVGSSGLANQLNRALKVVEGDDVFVVCADCCPDPNWLKEIKCALSDAEVTGGTFKLHIEDTGLGMRLIEFGGRFRNRLFQIALPDQGLFFRKFEFRALGGFDPNSLIPYARACRELATKGKFLTLKHPMRSSARQWDKYGKWATSIEHAKVFAKFLWRDHMKLLRYRR